MESQSQGDERDRIASVAARSEPGGGHPVVTQPLDASPVISGGSRDASGSGPLSDESRPEISEDRVRAEVISLQEQGILQRAYGDLDETERELLQRINERREAWGETVETEFRGALQSHFPDCRGSAYGGPL